MDEYFDIPQICTILGFSQKQLYKLSNTLNSHYHPKSLVKNNGEIRELSVPDRYLKSVQHNIVRKILKKEEISKYAMAYKNGTSIKDNAYRHISQDVMLKVDIRKFFDHITYFMVKENVFTAAKYSEKGRILLSILCIYNDILPQGAPTSPVISNIIMRDFDNIVGEWCHKHNIVYTRYSDDMTFSGKFEPQEVLEIVKNELRKKYLFLNSKKTVLLSRGQKKVVTGIVVNEKLSISKAYKKKIRQEIYYCKKFGIKSSLKYLNLNITKEQYVNSLLGRINYILSVEKENQEMINYRNWLSEIRKLEDFDIFKTKRVVAVQSRQMELFDYINFN